MQQAGEPGGCPDTKRAAERLGQLRYTQQMFGEFLPILLVGTVGRMSMIDRSILLLLD
jgi:hypothetical protein